MWLTVARAASRYALGATAFVLVTVIGILLKSNLTSVSCLYLLLVFAIAWIYGFWPATITSILAMACLDYFFTPPLFNFNITDRQNWVALGIFEAAATVIGRLSAKELRSAREAQARSAEMAQLYELSRGSLLLDMHQPPGPQLVVLIERIFNLTGVALFDANLDREYTSGTWKEDEAGIANECYLRGDSGDDKPHRLSKRVLQNGAEYMGALVLCGEVTPLVADALASLATMVTDRYQSFEKEERAEDASRAERLRAAVMDALAHELKGPLATVQLANSGLTELGGMTEPQRDLVALIDGETARMTDLCTRLLQTARLDNGRMGLHAADVSAAEVIEEVLGSLNETQKRREIRVSVDDPGLSVYADRPLLVMMLSQYIDNALKYSHPGTPIDVTAKASNTEALFSVRNFGSAIRIEDRERIFDRFYRSSDQKEGVPGTGIGLSVVKKAAEAHRGHVWAISEESEGTTFYLSLPKGTRRSQ